MTKSSARRACGFEWRRQEVHAPYIMDVNDFRCYVAYSLHEFLHGHGEQTRSMTFSAAPGTPTLMCRSAPNTSLERTPRRGPKLRKACYCGEVEERRRSARCR
jgi:hypothetical protein